MPDGIADVTTKLNVVFVCFVFLGGGRVVGGGVGREGEGQRGWGEEEERGGSRLLSL